MRRFDWLKRIQHLDPDADYEQIYRITVHHEFPWDMNQALSFALYRTFAVPSIGELLSNTGEFTERTQKRYDDTELILDAVLEHGFGSEQGRAAIRRMNQMHRGYPISNADMLYVLSVFVVVPIRWMAKYGWRELCQQERIASANYYRELGRQMNIKGIPSTYRDFGTLMDAYERAHFGFSKGGREVSDATLDLMTTFPPSNRLPSRLVRRLSLSLLDDELLSAFGYPAPTRAERMVVRSALRARGRVVRFLPPRVEPRFAREMPSFRSYPDGYRIDELGTIPATIRSATIPSATIPRGCPVHR
jgi:ER-bound oxygenase mpaB/B'/Rubber oxygenase, catalytic domain